MQSVALKRAETRFGEVDSSLSSSESLYTEDSKVVDQSKETVKAQKRKSVSFSLEPKKVNNVELDEDDPIKLVDQELDLQENKFIKSQTLNFGAKSKHLPV